MVFSCWCLFLCFFTKTNTSAISVISFDSVGLCNFVVYEMLVDVCCGTKVAVVVVLQGQAFLSSIDLFFAY